MANAIARIRDFARHMLGLTLINIHDVFERAGRPANWYADNVHPSILGHEESLAEIMRHWDAERAPAATGSFEPWSRPLVDELKSWLEAERRKLSSKHRLAKATDYMLKRWPPFVRFLDDGRVCLSNNAAERAVRGIAVGRKNWLFAASDSGGRRAASILPLIERATLNGLDAEAWLADVLARLADHPAQQIDQLLRWNWKPSA